MRVEILNTCSNHAIFLQSYQVDPQVARHLMDACILGLLKDKVRILITHQLQYLASMTRILLLVDGYPKFYGEYKALSTSGIPYTDILTRIKNENTHTTSTPSLMTSELVGSHLISGVRGSQAGSKMDLASPLHRRPSHHISTTSLMMENTGKNPGGSSYGPEYYKEDKLNGRNVTPPPHPLSILTTGNDANNAAKQPPTLDLELDSEHGPLEDEEELASGDISWRVYWAYLSSGSSCTALLVLVFAAITTQIVFTATDFWLQFW